MNFKKILFFILSLSAIIISISSNVYAVMTPGYIRLAIRLLRISVYLVLSIFLLFCIIYFIKSNQPKSKKIKTILIWLLIVILVCFLLRYTLYLVQHYS